MPSLRDLKRRIKSVSGIRQITRAMEMVSATKLRRSQTRIQEARPYTEKMDQILAHLGESVASGIIDHPLLQEHKELKKILIVAIASDKGLCGSFNSNVIRMTESRIRELEREGLEVSLLLVGRKIHDYFRRRGRRIIEDSAKFNSIDQSLPTKLLEEITSITNGMFLRGDTDRVEFIFTEFRNVMSSKPVTRQYLPIRGLVPETEEQEKNKYERVKDYIFEPGPAELLSKLVPKYARVVVFRALASSLASEHGQRMGAMRNATDNAGDMMRTLTLQRNKARQAAITKELAEIVGGAEALKG